MDYLHNEFDASGWRRAGRATAANVFGLYFPAALTVSSQSSTLRHSENGPTSRASSPQTFTAGVNYMFCMGLWC